ncbi:MAG: hypothetical protein ABW220_08635 [Burkholderiaceae bacterium]
MDIVDDTVIAEAGRELGHDFHRMTRLPLQPAWPEAVKEGFFAAEATRGPRRSADRFERKWLQLRLRAFGRHRVVAADLTVDLLRRLDVSHCPITRERLTHGTQAGTDWSIDRLNNDGAYAASNLAVMSVRANRAKRSLSFDEVLSRAEQAETMDGLPPAQWMRLAALMLGPSFTTRQHMAPILPLTAPLPAHSVRLALQQIQRLFTLEATRPAGKNALLREFRPACHSEDTARRPRRLADTVHDGLRQIDAVDEPWDVWLQPAVMQALTQWRLQLDPREWAAAAVIAGQLAGGSRVTARSLAGWHLSTGGYRPGCRQAPGLSAS